VSEGSSIRDLRQWVCWCSEERNGNRTKVPYSPTTGTRARSDAPETWGTFAEAREAARHRDYDGVGFVFTEDDPFCGVDLDNCLNPDTGEVEPWAMKIVEDLTSYTEISPSGTGLHIIVHAKLPEGGNRKHKIEMYDQRRFFTVTGRRLTGTPYRIEARQTRISSLHAHLFPPQEKPSLSLTDAAYTTPDLSDDEILHRATSAANGERFAALWRGDRSAYPSDSEADLALCSMLAFWTGPDKDRIASLVARSGLARDKWNREDYRRRTIDRALGGAVYEPGTNGPSPSRNGSSSESVIPHQRATSSPLPGATAFPVHAMPTACRSLIKEATAALGCAPELVALPMLATLSSAIGTGCIIEIKGGWREWAALFVAVVASPGAMKTPAAKVAKKPAFERQRGLGRTYADEKEDWKREVREWDVEKRDAQKAGEPAPEEPNPPTMTRCVASDTTVEALVAILEDNPRGLLVYKDELTGWVRSMDQYKGGKGSDRQHWLSFWSGDEVVVDRKSRMGEPIIVAKPFVSLFGGIQPAMLGELGAGTEDGLMDRFLFAYPAPRQVRFTEDEISAAAEARYAALYDALSNLTFATDEHGDPNPKPLKLTREARNLFAGVVDNLGTEMIAPGFPRKLEGVWAKMRGYLARLSLILAVCRCLETHSPEERIEAEDVEAATKLLDYFKSHARRVYSELSAPDTLDLLAADLKSLIETNSGHLEATATELYRALEDTGCESLPARPKELSQAVKALAARSSTLRVSSGHRGKARILRLHLAENSPGSPGSVGAGKVSTEATVATDARTEYETQPNPSSANATDARSQEANDGRERFTL